MSMQFGNCIFKCKRGAALVGEVWRMVQVRQGAWEWPAWKEVA